MRCAVVLALGDPRSADASTWIDAVAWLRQELSGLGYRVSVIDGEDVEGDLAHALVGVTPQDDVFVHVSGRLADLGVVRTAGGRWVRLQTLGEAIAERGGPNVSIFAELIHEFGPYDTRIANDHVDSIVAGIGAHARGYALVAAVRAASAPVEGLALTRLFLDTGRTTGEGGALISSAVYDRIANMPEGRASAQRFTFVRGASERPAPPVRSFAADRPLPSFASEAPLPSYSSEPLPSFASEAPLPSYSSEPLPSFASVGLPSFPAGPPLPSFGYDEPLPSFVSETDAPLPSYSSEPLPSFASEAPLPSYSSEPLSVASEPVHRPSSAGESIDEQITQATEAGDSARVVELRRERLRGFESGRLRVRELIAIARILQVELADASGAIDALEEARAIEPHRVGVLQALRRGYERRGSWEKVFEVTGTLADLAASPTERAELRVAQAQVALDQLHDHDTALALLEKALENDPTHERALAVFDALHALRPRTVDAPAATGGADESDWEKTEGASGTSEDDDETVAFDVTEGDLLSTLADGELAAQELPNDPVDPAVHATAFAEHWREGRTDAAFLAALALEELGAADVDQQILVDQFRSVAPIRARGSLEEDAWKLLRVTGPSDCVAALFGAVARAAVAMRIEELVARKALVSLDLATRLDEKSTASIMRSFQWAARVLGVPCPALYLMDEVPGDIAAVCAVEPSTALGPSVLSGRSAKELAFLAGRHLTYYRPEHQVLVYFPTGEDLTRLLVATIEIGAPGTFPAGSDSSVGLLGDRLSRHLTAAERTAIASASQELDEKVDLGRWARNIELTAGRAGLLLCGDLATAASLVRSESRPFGGLTSDDRRHDLISFVVSAEHRELRDRYVLSAAGSAAPPPAAAPGSPIPQRFSIGT